MTTRSPDFDTPVRVVILGGGFCGTRLAKKIEKHRLFSPVLIDRKSYFEYSPLVYKIPMDSAYMAKVRRPFTKILRNTELIIDEIVKVSPKVVETATRKLDYDILVIATGIDYPIRLKNRSSVFSVKSSEEAFKIAINLRGAERILIIGGGFIGVEVAAELATKAPDKRLTLVHSNKRILERLPPKAGQSATKFLRRHKVSIVTGEKIVEHQKDRYITDTGRIIKADLSIWSAGNVWNPAFMQVFAPTAFSSRNALKTNQFLQLRGYPHIFVGGDIAELPEEKTAQNAERHANLIAKNLPRLVKEKSLLPYSLQTRPLVVSLGAWNGILHYGNIVLDGLIPAIGKKLADWWILNQYS